ncbi:polynucleotide 5'-hydroxyl-kinase NOL9 [Artemisia annua]|uniref:Polynucleotide 5'-hydroxyl-kinase NOL9 n=1 Tax=Artemisia annua TaxID=35608 RepID=A0A2U1P619_ARTAN|nr:polynucleotide 5'-hydroxyl-kinase NOL9 [Artemisia annua]
MRTLPPSGVEEGSGHIAYDSITSPPPVCVVCGPRNSGKTAFSRHLVNVLIHRYRRVAYMDTDVGQAEFTPPGCLSLTVIDEETRDLAIPCLRTPERCFFFGDTTPKSDRKLYMAYVRALYDYYHEKYQQNGDIIGVPLVVNTPGWVEGAGFDILVEMLNHIAPTQVVQIRVSAENKNLPHGAFWLEEGIVHEVTLLEIKSDRYDSKKKTVQGQNEARLLRDLRLLAYFRKCFPTDKSLTTLEELDHGLAVHPPYEIPRSRVTIKQLHPEVPGTETKNTTSKIVGLAVNSSSSEDLPCCIGLGILKGEDTSKDVLYLITPIPENIVKKVDLLLHGLIKIPDCLRQVQGCVASNTLLTH